MKYERLTFSQFGKPAEVLAHQTGDTPPLKSGEVLIKILASPINPADLNYVEGTYGVKPELPAVSGIEGFGQVVESLSDNFNPGDNVIPIGHIGAWSSFTIASEDDLVRIEADLDPCQASMLKVNPATAELLLTQFGEIPAGGVVAFNAANSGVGQCIIQLAKTKGIRTIGFLRNLSLRDDLLQLGADCIVEDSKSGLEEARAFLGGDKASAAYNAVGGESALQLMKLLAPSSSHVTYGAMARKPLTIPNGPLIFNDIRVRGLWVSRWIGNQNQEALGKFYNDLAAHVASDRLKQEIDSTFELAQFKQALDRIDQSERAGKVLLQPLH